MPKNFVTLFVLVHGDTTPCDASTHAYVSSQKTSIGESQKLDGEGRAKKGLCLSSVYSEVGSE